MATRKRIVLKMEKTSACDAESNQTNGSKHFPKGKRNCFHSSVMHEMVWLECRISNNSLHTNVEWAVKDQQIFSQKVKKDQKKNSANFSRFSN